MTHEEAIELNKNLLEYMKIADKTSQYKFLEENYTALEMAISALKDRSKSVRLYEPLHLTDDSDFDDFDDFDEDRDKE